MPLAQTAEEPGGTTTVLLAGGGGLLLLNDKQPPSASGRSTTIQDMRTRKNSLRFGTASPEHNAAAGPGWLRGGQDAVRVPAARCPQGRPAWRS